MRSGLEQRLWAPTEILTANAATIIGAAIRLERVKRGMIHLVGVVATREYRGSEEGVLWFESGNG